MRSKTIFLILFLSAIFIVRSAAALDDAQLQFIVQNMTLEEKLGQLFMPGISGQTMTDELRALIQDNHLGGVLLFGGRNVMGRTQTAELTQALQDAATTSGARVPLLISIDQEGGIGSHVNMLTGGVDTVGNLALGASQRLEDTYDSYAIMAQDLRAYGINMDLGPVLDVLLNKDNTMNHIRSFGADPEAVAARGEQAVRGLQDNGVAACIKHYPGKGDTPVDSHHAAPVTDEDRATLEATILLPFRRAIDAGADSVMLNHEIYSALDPDVVATVSGPIISGLLKKDMGFEGLIITDSITMGGVTKTMDKVDAAYLSIKAGADMVLFAGDAPDSYEDSIARLKQEVASGGLSMERVDEAVLRILRVKNKYGLFENPGPAADEDYGELKKRNTKLSRDIARNTITVVYDPDGLLPLDRENADRILVVSPGAFFTVPLMETTFPIGTDLASKIKRFAPGTHAAIYDLKTLDRDREKALEEARDADVIVVGSILSYFSNDITAFINNLKRDSGKPVIVVGLSVPYDLDRLTDVDAFVAAYNPRSISLEAAAEVLFGITPARGALPVDVVLPETKNTD